MKQVCFLTSLFMFSVKKFNLTKVSHVTKHKNIIVAENETWSYSFILQLLQDADAGDF